jgi:hypothetical protein
MRVEAVNHTGWVVEEFKGSWVTVSGPTDRPAAVVRCNEFKKQNPNIEYRVYESVK